MDKKVISLAVCANVFILVKMNNKLNQTKKVTILTADLVNELLDKDIQREVNLTFEEIVENYED